ncbi:DUF6339 family protein [Enterococcus haemoperoxidus]|nr:DUF6339 family protein [Enterococcus haemoperoxidus]
MYNFMNIDKLLELKNSIDENIKYYQNGTQFLENPPKEILEHIDKKIILKFDGSNSKSLEVENVKQFYLAYKDMGLVDASSEGTWTLLTHTIFWNYVQQRWPLKSLKNSDKFIKDHYFKGQHFQSRNTLARLWWLGYFTYDETLENPWYTLELLDQYGDKAELSHLIVETIEIANSKDAIRILVESLFEMQEDKINGKKRRKFAREYIKKYNLRSAVRILGSLSKEQMKNDLEVLKKEFK